MMQTDHDINTMHKYLKQIIISSKTLAIINFQYGMPHLNLDAILKDIESICELSSVNTHSISEHSLELDNNDPYIIWSVMHRMQRYRLSPSLALEDGQLSSDDLLRHINNGYGTLPKTIREAYGHKG